MRSSLRKILVASLLTLTPFAATAGTMQCEVALEGTTGGWIPPQYLIEFDADTGTAEVSFPTRTGIITIDGSVSDKDPSRYTFAYVDKHLTDRSNQRLASMVYRLVYYKENNRLKVSAKPMGYANRFTGQGACQLS